MTKLSKSQEDEMGEWCCSTRFYWNRSIFRIYIFRVKLSSHSICWTNGAMLQSIKKTLIEIGFPGFHDVVQHSLPAIKLSQNIVLLKIYQLTQQEIQKFRRVCRWKKKASSSRWQALIRKTSSVVAKLLIGTTLWSKSRYRSPWWELWGKKLGINWIREACTSFSEVRTRLITRGLIRNCLRGI